MAKSFINIKDRIVAAAIKQINESGLASLSFEKVSLLSGIPLDAIVRNYGEVDELLEAVVREFVKFDKSVVMTIIDKDIKHIDKIKEVFTLLSTYYTNYGDMSFFVVEYEGFLHNVRTRGIISECIEKRRTFVMREYQLALDAGEVKDIFTPRELATILYGSASRDILYRRINSYDVPHSEFTIGILDKLFELLSVED